MKKVLIAGCPRSGLKYISHILSELGSNILSENVFYPYMKKDDTSKIMNLSAHGELSWEAVPFLPNMLRSVDVHGERFPHIYCIVRNPGDSLKSLFRCGLFEKHVSDPVMNFIFEITPEVLQGNTVLDKSAMMWHLYNTNILKAKELYQKIQNPKFNFSIYQIEELSTDNISQICTSIGLGVKSKVIEDILENTPTNIGTIGKKDYDDFINLNLLPTVLENDIMNLAHELGYN